MPNQTITSDLQKKLESNIWKFYIFQMLGGMFFAVPIMVLFWQENGLSLTQVMLLQSMVSILTVALEVPTGYFADIHGRKKTLMIASFSGALAMFTYSLGHNIWHFIPAEIFFAFAMSFMSGTTSAFLYDTLQDLKRESEYKKIWGHALFLRLMALAGANALGGFIATYSYRYALYASVPFFLLMIPLTLTMQEPNRHKIIFKQGYTKELIKIIKNTFTENKKLTWILIYSGTIFGFYSAALWLYQPYFELSGLKVAYFGLVFASFQFVAAISAKYAHKIEHKLGEKKSLIMLTVLVAGSYFLMSNFIYLFSFTFAYIQQFVRGFQKTVLTDYINKLTDSSIRATILSAQSFIGRLVYAIIIPVFGWIADVFTLIQALQILGITTLVAGGSILLMLKKDKVI